MTKVIANDILRDIIEKAHEAGQRDGDGSGVSSYILANEYCNKLFPDSKPETQSQNESLLSGKQCQV